MSSLVDTLNSGLRRASPLEAQLRDPQTTDPNVLAIQQADTMPAFTRGLRSGIQGSSSAIKSYVGGGVAALGGDPRSWEQAAHHDALLAQIAAPPVSQWKDVHGVGDALAYGAGKFGELLPALAPSMIPGGIAAGLRLSPAARLTAATAPMHPLMAGGVMERLNSDPVTAALPASEKFRVANAEGFGEALIFAAPGHIMQGRAMGLEGVVKPVGPLRTLRNVAGETAAASVGMGAASVGVGELGRTVQRQYNPDYMAGQDADQRTEEFMGGVAGFAPLAGAHATMAHTIGAGMKPASGAKWVGAKAYSVLNPAGKAAVDAAAATGSFTKEAYNAVKQHVDLLTGAAKDAFLQAKKTYSETQADNLVNGEGLTAEGTAVAMYKGALQGGAIMTEAAKKVGEGAAEDLKVLGTSAKDTFSTALGKVADYLTDPVKKLVRAGVEDKDLAGKLAEASQGALTSLFNGYGKYIDEHKLSGPDINAFNAAREKFNNEGMTHADAEALAPVIKKLSAQQGVREGLGHVAEALGEAATSDVVSSKGDYYNKTLRNALMNSGVDKGLVDAVAARVNADTIRQLGVTRAVQEAMKATGQMDRSGLERAKVQEAVEQAVREMREERQRRMPDAPEDPYMGPEYRELVRQNVEDLFANHPALKDNPQLAETMTDQMLGIVQKAANNEPGYHEAAKRMAEMLTEHFGEEGAAFAEKVQAMAEVRYGEKSPQAQRVGAFQEKQRSLGTLLVDFRKATGLKDANVLPKLREMASRYTDAKNATGERDMEKRAAELQLKLEQAQRAVPPDVKTAASVKYELNKLQEAMDTQADPVDAFRKEFNLDGRAFKRVQPILDAYLGSRVDDVPKPPSDNSHNVSANHIAEDDNDVEVNQRRAEQASANGFGDETSTELRENAQDETNINEQTEPPRFVGMEILKSGKYNHEDVQTPASRHPSDDYPLKHGMHGVVAAEAHAIYGHRVTEATWTSVVNWAREKSQELGVTEDSLLNAAMKKVLEHDQERLANAKLSEEDRDWIKRRIEFAEKVAKMRHPGAEFFHPDEMNRHYGYYKVEPSAAENLSYTADQLSSYGPREHHSGKTESDHAYVTRTADTEGVSPAAVKQSLVPIKVMGEDNNPVMRKVDLARVVANALTHQAGDVTGLGDKNVPGAARTHLKAKDMRGETHSTHAEHTPEELLNAVHSVLSAIMTGKGMHNDALSLRDGKGLFHLTDDGRGFLDPSVVIFRDRESRALTYGQLSHILGKDPKTGFILRDRPIWADADKKAMFPKGDTLTGRGRKNSGAKVDGKSILNEEITPETLNRDAEKQGVARNALGDRSINVRAMLKEAMRVHGLDPAELSSGKFPENLAAALLREAFKRFGIDQSKVFDSYKEGSNQRVFGNVEVYSRKFGQEEAPIRLQTLLNREEMRRDTGTPLRDVADARLHGLREALKAREKERAEAAGRKARGEERLSDLIEEKGKRSSQKDEYDQREINEAMGIRDERPAKALTHSDSEIEDARIKGLLEDAGIDAGKDTPLADIIEAVRDSMVSGKEDELDRQTRKLIDHMDAMGLAKESKAFLDTLPKIPKEPSDAHNEAIEARKGTIKELKEKKENPPYVPAEKGIPAEPKVASSHGEDRGGHTGVTEIKPTSIKTEILTLKKPSYTAKGSVANTIREMTNALPEVIHAKKAAKRRAELKAQARLERMGRSENRMFGGGSLDKAREAVRVALTAKRKQMNAELIDLSKPIPEELLTPVVKDTPKGAHGEDVPFSKSTGPERTVDSDTRVKMEEEARAEIKALAGKLVDGFQFSDKGDSWWDAAKKLINVSLSAADLTDARRHEVWHAVEDYLKSMGKDGERVLEQIYKHTDTPMMRRALAERLKNDEGALSQLGEQRERAAYAFQIFMRDGKLPLPVETQGFFGKIKDFFLRMAKKIGLASEGKHTENFFNYIKEGNLVRDMGNPASIRAALGETKSARFVNDVKSFTGPLSEAVSKVFGHTSTRMRGMGIEAYKRVADMYEGVTGKAGYSNRLLTQRQSFGNRLERVTHGLEGEALHKAMASDEYTALLGEFVNYMKVAGVDQTTVVNLFDKLDSFNQDAIAKNMEAFTQDVIKHGGWADMKDAEAKKIAQTVADQGFYFDPEVGHLFGDNAKIAEKWMSKNESEKVGRAIYEGVRLAERTRAFGAKDAKLKEALAEGHAKATSEQRKLAEDFCAAYDGTLGAGLISPSLQKVMGVLLTANNIRLLPMAVFSQMLEPMQLGFRKNDLGSTMDAFVRGIKDMPRTFETIDKKIVKDDWERYAEDMGTVASSIMGSILSGMSNGTTLRGLTGKVNDMFFRYNFMEQWNRSMHIASTKMGVEFIKEHALIATGKEGDMSTRFLKELGLEASDVKADDKGMLIKTDKLQAALAQYVAEAMAHPDAGSNTLWMNDPRFALLAHMKRFSFAHARYVLGRGVREFKLGNPSVLAPAVLAVPWMIAADSLRDAINPLADTSYKNNWGFTDYTMHGIERAGMFGRWQFPLDVEQAISMGGTGMEGALGPTAELFSRVARGAHDGHMLDALIGNLPGGPLIQPH